MFLDRNELWEFMEASRKQLTGGPACTVARLISPSHLRVKTLHPTSHIHCGSWLVHCIESIQIRWDELQRDEASWSGGLQNFRIDCDVQTHFLKDSEIH